MLYKPTTFLLPLFILLGRTILASPLESRTLATIEAVKADFSALNDTRPVNAGVRPNVRPLLPPPGSTQFTPNTGFHALAPQASEAFFAFSADGCSSNFGYSGYLLSSIAANTCYAAANYFESFYIDSASTLPYSFYVALINCGTSVQIPAVNTCYHVTNPNGSLWNLLIDFWRS